MSTPGPLRPTPARPSLSTVVEPARPTRPAAGTAAPTSNVEPAGLPATVTAQIAVACGGLDRPDDTHRVWIHRDGSVTTPDHPADVSSTAEQVASALGDATKHACGYWADAPRVARRADRVPVPDRSSWRMEAVGLWTTKAMWTALTGVLGVPASVEADPVAWLAYAQAFDHAGGLPEDPITHFGYLSAPCSRAGGWRRTSPVTPSELSGLLSAGVPISRVASAAALGYTPEQASAAVADAKRLRLPVDIVVHAAHAVAPERVVSLLTSFDPAQAALLPGRLRTAGDRVDEPGWTETRVAEFLAHG